MSLQTTTVDVRPRKPKRSPNPKLQPIRESAGYKWWVAAAFLIAVLFGFRFLAGVATAWHDAAQPAATAIEDIRLGQRVAAYNPSGERDYSLGSVNEGSWRLIRLVSGDTKMELLRPLSWVEAKQASPGATIPLRFNELDLTAPARVLAVEPCPLIEGGPGHVVTGKFHHPSREGDIYRLAIEGQDEPIEVTSEHPLWSNDRGEFVFAKDLKPGEELRTIGGTARVASLQRLPGSQDVFNIEVHCQHVYYVSSLGILAHNAGKSPPQSGDDPGPGNGENKWNGWTGSSVDGHPRPQNRHVPRSKPLQDFKPSQRKRIENKLQDIAHIRSGHPDPSGHNFPRDGVPFENREGLLPPSPDGYTEYHVPGKDGKPSGARIVIDESTGEVYYSQHYNDDQTGFSLIPGVWEEMFGSWESTPNS